MAIRVILADDHVLFLEGLSSLLKQQPGIELMGTAHNGKELLTLLATTPCDLVTLDLNMPELNGLDALHDLRTHYPQLRVLVLSNYEQNEFKKEVQRLGAHGYLLKNTSSEVLTHAIRLIIAGQTVYFEDKPTAQTTGQFFTDEFLRKYALTKREVDIIRCIADELTTREIADQLFISEHTVMTHRKNLLRKLDVKNTAGLVKFATEHGLLN